MLMDPPDLMLGSSDREVSSTATTTAGAFHGDWQHELKHHHHNHQDLEVIQAPIVYLDSASDVIKADDTELIKSQRRSGDLDVVTPLSAAMADPTVHFDTLELSYGASHDAMSVGIEHAAYPYHHTQHQQHPNQYPHSRSGVHTVNVGAFFQSLPLSIRANPNLLEFVVHRLAEAGFDTVWALAFIDEQELLNCDVQHPTDRQHIRSAAQHEFTVSRPPGPPNLHHFVTVSKWLTLCGIPPRQATFYSTCLHRCGYDAVQSFDTITHDTSALQVFRSGHYHLFKYYLDRVIQHHPHQHYLPSSASANNTYAMYYTPHPSASSAPRVHHDDLLDDLLPTSPLTHRASIHDHHAARGYMTSATASEVLSLSSSFTQMMHEDGASDVDTSGRELSESEMRLLYEAVNMDEKTNPCRRGKKVEWTVIATDGMGDPKFHGLAQYTAAELEANYKRHYEMPLNASARTSEWSPELVKLLWQVSQDSRCKNGTKTMWEQIAKGRTGVAEYAPLANFSNSQLRSRYRTEFGDKRPQSRRKAREVKNALARAAQAAQDKQHQATDPKSAAVLKSAAKHMATAAKARKDKVDEDRTGLVA